MMSTTPKPQTILQKMQAQARKDYLQQYALKFSGFLEQHGGRSLQNYLESKKPIQSSGEPKPVSMSEATAKLEAYLKQVVLPFLQKTQFKGGEHLALQNELSLVLLPNIGSDAKGIRTNLAEHYNQLKLQQRAPFVDLTEEGLSFNWDSQEAQQCFCNLLKSCGIDVSLATTSPSLDNYSKATYGVMVSHHHLEKVLRLSQYHPYNLQEAANDLYKAAKLDRATCLVLSTEGKMDNPVQTVRVHETARLKVNEKNDLVAVSLDVVPSELIASQPHHIVILLDDSGSMHGAKMQAANQALKQLIYQLPNDTLVSLQPFNAKTALVKQSVASIKKMASEQQKNIFEIPATDGTPLIEMLACSALFLRNRTGNEENFLLTEADLNNATVVMITDGQANGTAENAINTMQTSVRIATTNNIQIPHMTKEEQTVSYGVNGFSCRQLPVVFSIAIGSDSDQKFIEDLAQQLNSPHAFIDTNSNDLKQQTEDAFNLLLAIKGRIPSAFVGISYIDSETNEKKVAALEMHNLFLGRTRTVEFLIPPTAIDLQVCLMANGSHTTCRIAPQNTQNPALIKAYVEAKFLQLRLDYSARFHQLQALIQGNGAQIFGGQGRFAQVPTTNVSDTQGWDVHCFGAFEEINPSKLHSNTLCMVNQGKKYYNIEYNIYFVKDGQFSEANGTKVVMSITSYTEFQLGKLIINDSNSQTLLPIVTAAVKFLTDAPKKVRAREDLATLTAETTLKISSLQSLCQDSQLASNMALFSEAIQNPQVIEKGVDFTKSDVHNSRHAVAQFTQTRFLGKPVPSERLKTIEKTIFTEIDAITTDCGQVLGLINNKPDLLTQVQQTNEYQATPLIYAVVQYISEQGSERKKALKKLIKAILKNYHVSMLNQDAQGQTVLHRAVWHGEVKLAKLFIKKAIETGELAKLKGIRNKVLVGASQGETFVENLRATDKLQPEDKKALLSLIAEQVQSTTLFSAIAKIDIAAINSAIEEHPEDLNRHGEAKFNLPTPLFSMLYQLKHGNLKTMQQAALRNCILELLERYKDVIDICESNAEGNTPLHYALFHGEFEVAEKILLIASEKKQLADALKARNVLVGAEGKGEIPVHNFIQQYTELCKQFKGVCDTINAIAKSQGGIVDFSQLDAMLVNQFQQAKEAYFQCRRLYEFNLPPLQRTPIC